MSKSKAKGFFSDQFKDLFIQMVQLDPTKRLTLEEVKKHPWMKEPVPT